MIPPFSLNFIKFTYHLNILQMKNFAQLLLIFSLIFSFSEVNCQIMYTDVVPDSVVNIGDSMYIDLDGDGVDDVKLYADTATVPFLELIGVVAAPLDSNQLISGVSMVLTASIVDVTPLNSGTSVDSLNTNWNENFTKVDGYDMGMAINFTGSFPAPPTGTIGTWFNATDKYIGIKFDISDVWYYGWIRCNVNAAATQLIIKDYAYEQTPGKEINTGATGNINLSVKRIDKSNQVRAYFTQGDLIIESKYEFKKPSKLNVMSITGEMVYKGQVQTSKNRYSLSHLPVGVYLVEMEIEGIRLVKKLIKN